jgi:hypothetical protein
LYALGGDVAEQAGDVAGFHGATVATDMECLPIRAGQKGFYFNACCQV